MPTHAASVLDIVDKGNTFIQRHKPSFAGLLRSGQEAAVELFSAPPV